MCFYKKHAEKTPEQPSDDPKPSILKPSGEQNHNEKKIKFEDETMDENDDNLFITTKEFIEQLEEFFQVKQSVVLLDLYELSNISKPPEASE